MSLAFVAGTVLALAGGAGWALVLGVRGRAALLAAALVLAAAIVVLGGLGLSLVHELRRGPWLLATLALAASGLGLARGRPRPSFALRRPHAPRATLVLAAAAAVALALQLVTALVVAPDSPVTNTYHLSKAAYWLQYGSAEAFPNATWRHVQTAVDGELLQAWTMALNGSDRFTQVVPWLALVACALLVYAGARELRAPPSASGFAAALFVVLPQPILQASSGQNNLTVAAFVAASALFAVRGLRDRHRGELVVAAAATGLAVGTKGTALVVAPVIAVLVGAVLWQGRPPLRLVAFAAAALAVAVAAFGLFSYTQTTSADARVVRDVTLHGDGGGHVVRNAGAVVLLFADLPGLPVDGVNRALAHVDGRLVVHDRIHEDYVAFGAVGLVMLFPLLLFSLTRPRYRVLAAAGLLGFAVIAVALASNPWLGRILIAWVVLVAPLFALLEPARWLAVGLALVSLVPCLVAREQRPPSAWGQSRAEHVERAFGPKFATLDAKIGRRTAIGLVGSADTLEYPYFDDRRVERLTPRQAARFRGPVVWDAVDPPPGVRAEPLGPGAVLVR